MLRDHTGPQLPLLATNAEGNHWSKALGEGGGEVRRDLWAIPLFPSSCCWDQVWDLSHCIPPGPAGWGCNGEPSMGEGKRDQGEGDIRLRGGRPLQGESPEGEVFWCYCPS